MTCCEQTAKHDVENDEEVRVVKMEERVIKKDMEYKETMRKKAIHPMKDHYKKSVEMHNEPRLKVDEQQYDIKIKNKKVVQMMQIKFWKTPLLKLPRKKSNTKIG